MLEKLSNADCLRALMLGACVTLAGILIAGMGGCSSLKDLPDFPDPIKELRDGAGDSKDLFARKERWSGGAGGP